jgi:hypothetical protein
VRLELPTAALPLLKLVRRVDFLGAVACVTPEDSPRTAYPQIAHYATTSIAQPANNVRASTVDEGACP